MRLKLQVFFLINELGFMRQAYKHSQEIYFVTGFCQEDDFLVTVRLIGVNLVLVGGGLLNSF
jgi:hypothetical protein